MLFLPSDVLFLVCEELGNRRDFHTLFNCALASKSLASPALLWLYRIHSSSKVINSESTDADLFLKWTLQWKSIIRSSLGKTAYPYCLYIRSLNLRDLPYLFEDPLFRDNAIDIFFEDEMAGFFKTQETRMKHKMRSAKASARRLNIPLILEMIGESITSFISEAASQNKTTVAVEELSGTINAEALAKWVSRLSKLRSITLWDGSVLNDATASAIAENCYDFDDLTFFTCSKNDADEDLSLFFSGLRSNTLRSFAALGANAIGSQTLLSLNSHSKSLRKLKLNGLKADAMKKLPLLQGCKNLETFELKDADGLIITDPAEEGIDLETTAWLCGCDGLRELILRNLFSGPTILTQVCLQNNIRLRTLVLDAYPLVGNQDFHKALSHQTTLESLELRADPDSAFRDDINILVSSISKLHNLKYLNLLSTSDYFRNSEILTLASHLTNLEELWFGGYDVNDDLWHGLACLRHLRALNIHAVSSFSFDGILTYVGLLQDNQGLMLSIMNQTAQCGLSYEEESAVRRTIAEKVGGTFEFTLFREADSESELFSD